jgi:hypothetical protein
MIYSIQGLNKEVRENAFKPSHFSPLTSHFPLRLSLGDFDVPNHERLRREMKWYGEV